MKKSKMKFVVNNAHLQPAKQAGKNEKKKEEKQMEGNSKQNHVYGLSITKQWPKHAHSVMPYKLCVSDFVNGIKLYVTDMHTCMQQCHLVLCYCRSIIYTRAVFTHTQKNYRAYFSDWWKTNSRIIVTHSNKLKLAPYDRSPRHIHIKQTR